jgi:hypothetical protein
MTVIRAMDPARRVEAERAYRDLDQRIRTGRLTPAEAERQLATVEARFGAPEASPRASGTASARVARYLQAFDRTRFDDPPARRRNGKIDFQSNQRETVRAGDLGFHTVESAGPRPRPDVQETAPVARTAIRAFDGSDRTLADLQALAKTAPYAAREFLERLAKNLRAQGATAEADQVQALLAQPGKLAPHIPGSVLAKLYPETADGWAQLQVTRNTPQPADPAAPAAPVNGTPPAPPPLSYLKGKLEVVQPDPNNAWTKQLRLTTADGKTWTLNYSTRQAAVNPMPFSWAQAFAGDGTVSLMGVPASDGSTFNVEGFALDKDSSFDTFTSGRVQVEGSKVTLSTSRGDVSVTSPRLKEKLAAMPMLGVILPGAPKLSRGKLVYDEEPKQLIGLGRFAETQTHPAQRGAPGTWAVTDMAWSNANSGGFAHKPVILPPRNGKSRVDHQQRMYLLGNIVLNRKGEAARFEATYVSQSAEGINIQQVGAEDADAVQRAVLATTAKAPSERGVTGP